MSRNIVRNTATRFATTSSMPRWVAALPLAGMLVACSSFAQDGSAEADHRAVLDFHSCAKPQYPHAELAAHHEGTVRMKFLVNVDGSIASSRVEHTSGFQALDDAALSALNQCRFRPAYKNGEPVQTWQEVQYVWTTQ